jgi:hypothetical protein
MPAETVATHTHVYTSYLLSLKDKCWAYQNTSKIPGRNMEERTEVVAARALSKEHSVHGLHDDRHLIPRECSRLQT